METIKAAIWGETNDNTQQQQQYSNIATPSYQKEPQSGVTGDVSRGEPYDAGNMTPRTDIQPSQRQLQQPRADMLSQPLSTSSGLLEHREASTTNRTDLTPNTDHSESSGGNSNNNSNSNDNNKTEELFNPENITGPGPKPIAEVARDHDGHIPEHKTPMTRGVSSVYSSVSSSSSLSGSSDRRHRHDSVKEDITSSNNNNKGQKSTLGATRSTTTAATDDPDSHPMNQDGTHPHTDDYISSGMVGDGGNFDVSKPGAGKEAQRLIHQGALTHLGEDIDKKKKKHGVAHLPKMHKKHSNEKEQGADDATSVPVSSVAGGKAQGVTTSDPSNDTAQSPTTFAPSNGSTHGVTRDATTHGVGKASNSLNKPSASPFAGEHQPDFKSSSLPSNSENHRNEKPKVKVGLGEKIKNKLHIGATH